MIPVVFHKHSHRMIHLKVQKLIIPYMHSENSIILLKTYLCYWIYNSSIKYITLSLIIAHEAFKNSKNVYSLYESKN